MPVNRICIYVMKIVYLHPIMLLPVFDNTGKSLNKIFNIFVKMHFESKNY